MTESTLMSCDRDDNETLNKHVKQSIQTLVDIPSEDISSMLCIVTKKPSLDEDGDMAVGRTFITVGTVRETAENVMEIISKTGEMLEETKHEKN
jgi:hypothetical protein